MSKANIENPHPQSILTRNPQHSIHKIIGFTFENNQLNAFEEINQLVDFSKTLSSQYNFINPIEDEINCINVK